MKKLAMAAAVGAVALFAGLNTQVAMAQTDQPAGTPPADQQNATPPTGEHAGAPQADQSGATTSAKTAVKKVAARRRPVRRYVRPQVYYGPYGYAPPPPPPAYYYPPPYYYGPSYYGYGPGFGFGWGGGWRGGGFRGGWRHR